MPIYVPTVDPQNLPNARLQAPQSVGLDSENQGRQYQELGHALQQGSHAFNAFIIANNESAVRMKVAKAMDEQSKLLLAYQSLPGKDAVENQQNYLEAIQQTHQSIADSLDNDRQRGMFGEASMRLQTQAGEQIAGHALQQGKVYEAQSHQALAQSGMDQAIANITNPSARDLGFDTARANAAAAVHATYGENADPKIVEMAQQDITVKTLLQMVQNAATSNDPNALPAVSGFYHSIKDRTIDDKKDGTLMVAPSLRDSIEKTLNQADISNQALSAVNALQADAVSAQAEAKKKGESFSRSAWIDDRISSTYAGNAKMREAVRAEWEHQDARKQQQMSQADTASVGDGYNMIESGWSWAAVSKSQSYQALMLSEQNGSPHAAKYMADLRNYFDAHQKELRGEADNSEGDPAALVTFTQKVVKGDASLSDLMSLKNTLNKSQFQFAQNALISNGKNDAKETQKVQVLSGALSSPDVKNFLVQYRLDPKKNSQEYDAFLNNLQSSINAHVVSKGSISQQDGIDIARALLKPVVMNGMLWNSTVPAYKADASKVIVPPDARSQVVAALNKSGVKNPTEQQITQVYMRGAGK